MTIYIDADGCPVVKQTLRIARAFSLPCVILCDTAHRIVHEGARTIVVGKGADSVDFRLVNLVQKGDLVITQDYGLAAMCLGKRAISLNQDGMEYTADNISGLLEFRAISKKIRQSGGRMKGLPKRSAAQNQAFEAALRAKLTSLTEP